VILISLIFLAPLPLTNLSPYLTLSIHDFVHGLLALSRQLDLVFVLDPSEVLVSRIDPLVVPEDRYHPTLELTCLDTLSPLLFQT